MRDIAHLPSSSIDDSCHRIDPPYLVHLDLRNQAMRNPVRASRWSRIFLSGLALLVAGGNVGLAQTPPGHPLPDSITCAIKPYYRYRPDGKPGREVQVRFRVPDMVGPATLEVHAGASRDGLRDTPR